MDCHGAQQLSVLRKCVHDGGKTAQALAGGTSLDGFAIL